MGEQATRNRSACPTCGESLHEGLCTACSLGDLLGESALSPEFPSAEGEPLDVGFGDYLLQNKLASGGMGVVYVAEDRRLKRTVALKMIRGAAFAGQQELARFKIEAEAAAVLDHPNIVPIYEVGSLEGQPYFTMKLIEGASLAQRLKSADGGRLVPRDAAATVAGIAAAVEHAHHRGVLHRDLKPGNVLIDRDGKAWLTDFGLAKVVGGDHGENGLTMTSAQIGTPHYMAPELVRSGAAEVSTASDVWALGVILWEALFGVRPFSGSSPAEIMRRIEEAQPERPAGAEVPRDLVTLAGRCLKKRPEKRIPTAGFLAEELGRWSRGEPIESRPVGALERAGMWVRRRPVWAALVAAVVVGFVCSFSLWKRAERANADLTETNEQLGRALAIATATKLASGARLAVDDDPLGACVMAVRAAEATEPHGIGTLPAAAEALTDVLQKVGGRNLSPFDPLLQSYDESFLVPDWVQQWNVGFEEGTRRALLFHVMGRHRAAVVDLEGGGPGEAQWDWFPWAEGEYGAVAMWWGRDRLLLIDSRGDVDFCHVPPTGRGGEPPRTAVGNISEPGWWLQFCEVDRATGKGIGVLFEAEDDELGFQDLLQVRFEIDPERGRVERLGSPRPAGVRHRNQSVIFDPGQRWFLVSGADGATRLVDTLGDGEEFVFFDGRTDLQIHHPRFSPCGRWLVMRKGAGTVLQFDLRDRAALRLGEGELVLEASDVVRGNLFSPDGNLLAVVGESDRLWVCSTDPPAILHPLKVEGIEYHQAVTFSPDGRWLAAGGGGRVARVWDVEGLDGAVPPRRFGGLPTVILDLDFEPDGCGLVAAGVGSCYRVWDFDPGAGGGGHLPSVLTGGRGEIRDIAVSPDGRWVATARDTDRAAMGRHDGVVELSSAGGAESFRLTTHGDLATSVAFSAGGVWLATTGIDRLAKVWNLSESVATLRSGADPEPAFVLDMSDTRPEYLRKVTFHPSGRLYCVCGDGRLFHWDLRSLEPERGVRRVHSRGYLLPDAVVSPDGRWLAIARHGWDDDPIPGYRQAGNMVLLFDVRDPANPEQVGLLPAKFKDVTNLDFSPDSRWLVAGSTSAPALVWDMEANDVRASVRRSDFDQRLLGAVAWSPDGRWCAVGGIDGEIHLWDPRPRGAGTRTIHTGDPVHGLAWLDDTRLVSGGATGRIEVWETDLERLKRAARILAGQ